MKLFPVRRTNVIVSRSIAALAGKFSSHSRTRQFILQYQKQLMILPAMIFLIVFAYIPMYGIIIAFKNYKASKGIWGSEWVGLQHFKLLIDSSFLEVVIRNTLKISVTSLLLVFPAPIILALLLNELRSAKFKRVVQTISYLPHFVSWVIVAGMFYNLLSADGLINNLLIAFGFQQEAQIFLAKSENFLPLVILTSIWKEIGWESIIILAALTAVDPEMHEAATIDGAGRLKRAWHISIPTILPTIVILFIFALSNLLSSNFDQIYLLQNPSIIEASETIDTYAFKVGISQGQFDYGTAVGLLKAVIGFALLLIANRTVRKLTSHGLW